MSVCIWTCFFLSVRGYFNSYFQPQDVTFFGLLGALLPDLHRGSICPWTPPGDFRPPDLLPVPLPDQNPGSAPVDKPFVTIGRVVCMPKQS